MGDRGLLAVERERVCLRRPERKVDLEQAGLISSCSSWARVGAGRRSQIWSCTERVPRNSLIWGWNSKSSRLKQAAKGPDGRYAYGRTLVCLHVMGDRGLLRIFRCRPPPTSQQDTTAAERSSSTGLGLPDPKGSSSSWRKTPPWPAPAW